MNRNTKIRKMLREQIAEVLRCDLDGDEQVMKEVWEQVESDDEDRIARDELARVIRWLRSGK